MNSLLIRNVLLDNRKVNILIEGNIISKIGVPSDSQADTVIEAEGKAILPAFYNTHTHSPMTLMRGYGDDIPLDVWLNKYIWPFEDKMTAADMHRGSEMAVKEMIHTGTVFFSDMYFLIDETIDVVEKAGIRAAIGLTFLTGHSLALQAEKMEMLANWQDPTGGRVSLTIDPHAIYTADAQTFRKCADLCREYGLKMHTHLAETDQEVKDCIAQTGMTPVRYLDSLGVLGPNVIAAHCVKVDKEEWDILAERGVTVAHCPCSNMKLGSGRFPYELAISSGCRITLGTDGAASNNNLDLREEMKFAALLAKVNGDPELLSANQVFEWATKNGAEAYGINAGEIKEGKLADAILVDMDNILMQPCFNLISNLVYSADSSCISTVICNGRILK